MVEDLVSEIDSYLLTRIIYATTHLALIVTDYGEYLANDVDGKFINTHYGPFWSEATARFCHASIHIIELILVPGS